MLDAAGPEQVAADRRVSLATAWTHLLRISDKIGTRRQGQLVRLLLAYV